MKPLAAVAGRRLSAAVAGRRLSAAVAGRRFIGKLVQWGCEKEVD
jgi:hypothetical protein